MTKDETIQKALQIFESHHGLLRTQQALNLGISSRTLYALRDMGRIIRLSRGLYQLADRPVSEYYDLVIAAQRVQQGIVCLLSALEYHQLTTQIPHQVYLALPKDAEKPRLEYPPLRLFWFSGESYQAGIEEHILDGAVVRIYCAEKSVADCFKFRNKVGLDVTLEALKLYRKSEDFDLGNLVAFARIDRVEKVMQPYLEALV